MDESLKKSRSDKLYKPLDEFLKRLKKKIKQMFASLYVSGFDQLNIIRLGKMSETIYQELDEFNRKNYVELVRHARSWAEWILGKKLSSADLDKFVKDYLKGYDPVTQYVYTKEVDRKRMRMNEAILTAKEFQDLGKLQKAVKKAADLWYTQSSQYALDLMLEEIEEAYKDDGDVSLLRWNTMRDEKVCPECGVLDGQVFDADAYPPPPHYNCRCYPTPENPENDV